MKQRKKSHKNGTLPGMRDYINMVICLLCAVAVVLFIGYCIRVAFYFGVENAQTAPSSEKPPHTCIVLRSLDTGSVLCCRGNVFQFENYPEGALLKYFDTEYAVSICKVCTANLEGYL